MFKNLSASKKKNYRIGHSFWSLSCALVATEAEEIDCLSSLPLLLLLLSPLRYSGPALNLTFFASMVGWQAELGS